MAVKQGFRNVYVLQGGLPGWEQNGYAIYAGPEYEAKNTGILFTPQQVQELIAKKADTFLLVDVREPVEYAEKHLPGAINIPITQLSSRITALDRNKTIIFYCVSGGRSYNAIRKVRMLGFNNIGHVTLEDWEKAGFKLIRP